MKIKVIGKAHREGTNNRTGKDYNFNQVHYNGPDRGVEGLAALTQSLDPSLIPFNDIRIGGESKVDFGPVAMWSASRPSSCEPCHPHHAQSHAEAAGSARNGVKPAGLAPICLHALYSSIVPHHLPRRAKEDVDVPQSKSERRR